MAATAGFLIRELEEEQFSAEWERLAAETRCLRCGGLMVIEQGLDFPVRRCVQCGEVIDPVILRNRLHRSAMTAIGRFRER